jgi:hypothetical protein
MLTLQIGVVRVVVRVVVVVGIASAELIITRKRPPILTERAVALLQPQCNIVKKEFWFGYGEMTMSVQLPKALCTPGEELPINVVICNTSGKRVEKTVVSLVRRELWKYPSASITEYVCNVVHISVRCATVGLRPTCGCLCNI